MSLCGQLSWLFVALDEVFLLGLSGNLQELRVEVSRVRELRLIAPFSDVSLGEG